MSDFKKHLIQLMEEVDIDYQAPQIDANSGNGITKFAPTPASKVLKNYQVDGDFLRKAISYGGVDDNAVNQIMGGIDTQQCDGPLCGSHFDSILGGFGVGSPETNIDPMSADEPVDTGIDASASNATNTVDMSVPSTMGEPENIPVDASAQNGFAADNVDSVSPFGDVTGDVANTETDSDDLNTDDLNIDNDEEGQEIDTHIGLEK
jgi:hypothetical protein